MHLDIPNEILEANNLNEEDLLLELAVALYAARKISFGQAQRLSGLDWFKLRTVLHERQIPAHYDIEDLETDINNLQHLHSQ